ncbi:hypothetical protein OAS1_19250 [Bacillus sp. YKCMOAS1]|nr:hypothetical protein OAS1_19250 [Bacillus sp. YKCMOAS1]
MPLCKKAESDEVEELEAAVTDFPELKDIPSLVEEYEKTTAKLLRLQRRTFLNALNGFYIQGRFGDVRSNFSVF